MSEELKNEQPQLFLALGARGQDRFRRTVEKGDKSVTLEFVRGSYYPIDMYDDQEREVLAKDIGLVLVICDRDENGRYRYNDAETKAVFEVVNAKPMETAPGASFPVKKTKTETAAVGPVDQAGGEPVDIPSGEELVTPIVTDGEQVEVPQAEEIDEPKQGKKRGK